MAWSERTTTVANPATRKRRKVRNVARKLSLKQKLHFGSKQQRAAARRALSGARKRKRNAAARHRPRTKKRNPVARRRRKPVAPHRRRTVANRAPTVRRRRKKNSAHSAAQPFFRRSTRRRKKVAKRRRNSPGGIIAMTLAPLGNPARRRKKAVATSKRRRKANASRRRKSNAGRPRRRANRSMRHRRRSNPGKMGNLITQALGVAGGAIGSKLLTQMVLGSNNTSFMGYAGNLVAGGILAYATKLATKSQELAAAVMVGAVTQVALRMITDLTPFGSVVSGTGLGDYQISNFWNPQRLNSPRTATFNQNWMGSPAALVTATAPVAAAGAIPGVAASSNSMW
jgi:hypothetical protein